MISYIFAVALVMAFFGVFVMGGVSMLAYYGIYENIVYRFAGGCIAIVFAALFWLILGDKRNE